MSLRFRLLAAIFLALLISFSVGTGLATWHAARMVHDELAAALGSARQATLAALPNLPAGVAGAAELHRMVSAFDGNQHVQAALLDPAGQVSVASVPAVGKLPPRWFLHMVSPSLKSVAAPVAGVPRVSALRLTADAASEAGERWTELRERIASIAVFFVVAAALCSATVGHSLQPLTALLHGFARVGRGELGPPLAEAGPPEIATLAGAFNRMAAALRAAEAQNRRLAQQVVTIAEEERAEIARDLHDEIGPLLFATTTFAAAIGRMVETGEVAAVPAQLRAIQDATAQVQREVRDMLGRLHQGSTPPPDLAAALAELIAFWQAVRPDIAFSANIAMAHGSLGDAARECLFRAAQEGLSNAVRHGHPQHVWIDAGRHNGVARLSVRDDGAGKSGRNEEGPTVEGLGLAGMRVRAAALGGQVDIVPGPGWTVTVTLPQEAA